MKVAVPVWENNISPVLDAAKTIRIYEIDESGVNILREINFGNDQRDVALMISENAEVLICGALSDSLEARLNALGVKVHPWVMGGIEDIIKCYSAGLISFKENSMPGCRRRRFKHCTGNRQSRFYSGECQKKENNCDNSD
jgi:predicted Fe-Mo cluster-binding NifX family protein